MKEVNLITKKFRKEDISSLKSLKSLNNNNNNDNNNNNNNNNNNIIQEGICYKYKFIKLHPSVNSNNITKNIYIYVHKFNS